MLSCSTDDSFSHYALSVHGCRLSLFYWPDVAAARPVKFLWKLEQVLWELWRSVTLSLHLLYSSLDAKLSSRNRAFSADACLAWGGGGVLTESDASRRIKSYRARTKKICQIPQSKSLYLITPVFGSSPSVSFSLICNRSIFCLKGC